MSSHDIVCSYHDGGSPPPHPLPHTTTQCRHLCGICTLYTRTKCFPLPNNTFRDSNRSPQVTNCSRIWPDLVSFSRPNRLVPHLRRVVWPGQTSPSAQPNTQLTRSEPFGQDLTKDLAKRSAQCLAGPDLALGLFSQLLSKARLAKISIDCQIFSET